MTPNLSGRRVFARHLAALLALLLLAGVLATLRGALWPFDLRASALMTLSGLAGVATGWGLYWGLPVLAGTAVPRVGLRLALWPVIVLGWLGLHALSGPAHGFAPLAVLGPGGALALYAVPVALALLLGSALRALARGLRRAPRA